MATAIDLDSVFLVFRLGVPCQGRHSHVMAVFSSLPRQGRNAKALGAAADVGRIKNVKMKDLHMPRRSKSLRLTNVLGKHHKPL